MLDFFVPSIDDRQWMQPMIERSGYTGADVSFGSLFLWGEKYKTRVARLDTCFIRATFKEDTLREYYLPVGECDLTEIIGLIVQDAQQRGIAPRISLIPEDRKALLESLFPGQFQFQEEREKADYLYLQEDLANLAGRKYHGKRNHISKFKRTNENYKIEKITKANQKDALYVAREWCILNGDEDCRSSKSEYCAITKALKYFDELEMQGAVLYVDGAPVAMTMASKINDDVCDVHFEKALNTVEGCYPVINNEFSKILSQYQMLNREEDLGIEGLRKAKLSYNPAIILTKYTATPVNTV